MPTFPVLIIGAGPFGLSLAAYLRHMNINSLLVGKPATFWKTCIAPGTLRDLIHDCHLDPLGVDTVAAYRQENSLSVNGTSPVSFERYARWFQGRNTIQILPWHVERIATKNGMYIAFMGNGEQISATNLVLATCLRACSLVGCKVNAAQVTLLRSHDIFARLHFQNGYPQLDHQFQTSMPGLFIASMTAEHNFRRPTALFAQARASATAIGQAIHHRIQTG